MSAWSRLVSMISEPHRAGSQKVHSCTKGRSQLLVSEYGLQVLRIDTGVVATPLFWVNVPTARERIGLGAKFSGLKPDDHIELRQELQAPSLSLGEDLRCRKVL